MAGGHVRNLVCHYPGQFRFIIGRQYQSGIYIKKSTGQREGVHLVRIDNLNSEGDLGIRVAHQILPNAIDVLCDHGIRDHFRGAFHLLGELLAHLDLPIQAVPVAHASPATHVAVADSTNVFEPAGVLLRVFI